MSAVNVNAIRTTCAYCGVGCGINATVGSNGRVEVVGDPLHPANYGRLCAKGASLGESLVDDGRLLRPEIGGCEVTWDTAITRVASHFKAVIAEYGPEAVGFYVSGQLLTEDYYVANKLMKGFIGASNIDTNSRLCMASSVAGHKRAFGEDIVPGTYTDLEIADLVVLVGSNLAWCHPVLHQRLLDARANRGTKIVVIDPRATATTEECDLHLAIKHGGDVALFNGLLAWLAAHKKINQTYINSYTNGFDSALAQADEYSIQRVSKITGLSPSVLTQFFKLFAEHEATVTVYSQGVNQSRSGTDKVNAIINCHLATGRIGQPGAGPFSVTGQPNAMGGREVGGLANTLAAHIDFDDPIGMQSVRDFWQAPNLAAGPGLKAVELFEAAREGKIKALWIMATNPSVSMPATTKVRQALAKCPFVVVSDVVRQSDTAAFADVLLPALGWGEKDGTVTNSERCISRQRALQPGPVGAKADWWIISAVARRMGYIDAFSYQNPAEIFAEYAAMTTLDSKKPRALNLANLVGISEKSYDELAPQIWPSGAEHSDFRLFANGRFSTVDQRARFVATEWRETGSVTDDNYPLALTSGRVRDQWHTMTRTGLVPRLAGHIAEPFIEIHPQDAAKYNIEPASIVELREHNSRPPILVRALITSRVAAGCCFVPMHFSAQQTSAGLVNDVFTGFTDPISGQPELKHSAISVRPFAASWYAFAISRSRPADPSVAYWARMRAASGWRLEMAGHEEVEFEQLFATLAGPLAAGTATHRYEDKARGVFRLAAFENKQLVAALFTAREPVATPRAWAADLLEQANSDELAASILAGCGGNGLTRGALICSCHSVDSNTIGRAIEDGHCTIDAVGSATLAGTGCGSCRMEIRRLIDSAEPPPSLAQAVTG